VRLPEHNNDVSGHTAAGEEEENLLFFDSQNAFSVINYLNDSDNLLG
jgi:hypothetical protein